MTKRTALILGLQVAVGIALAFLRDRNSVTQPKLGNIKPSPAPGVPTMAQTEAQRFLELESKQAQEDQTIWAREMEAQRHEQVFIKLWDQLRASEDFVGVCDRFSQGDIVLGTLSKPANTGQAILQRHLENPTRRLGREEWLKLLRDWKENGFRLEQSEWRHARFVSETNGAASSVFALTLHVRRAEPEQRWIVRGDLRVSWRRGGAATEEPFPEVITANDLEVLSRDGVTPFDHKVVADITPEKPDPKLLEPSLLLYDLDGDGLSEIILPRRNLVYWNLGRGKFRNEPLCEHPLAGLNATLLADFDGDGRVDLLGVDAAGLVLFAGDATGHFRTAGQRVWQAPAELANPFVMTAGDVDGDDDLDVWLAQYKPPYQGGQMPTPYFDANDGHPSFLLRNDGRGNFSDQTEAAGLAKKRFRRTYSCSFVDLDDDGALDLLVVSDFAGADVYRNDGAGHFTEVTSAWLDEAHAFGMAHAFGDFDGDGQLDLFVVGMHSFAANRLEEMRLGPTDTAFAEWQRMRPKMAYGNRLLTRRGAGFRHTNLSTQVARTGWSWGVTGGDFDNDGWLDLYVVNGHISGQTARDYESQFWRHDIYTANSADDPALDTFFRSTQMKQQGSGMSYGGFEKNRLLLNQAGAAFLEAAYLAGVALEEDCRNVVSDDLDGDGKLELLATTFQSSPTMRQSLHLFPNFTPDGGNWIGFRLREEGRGFSPVGAKIILTTARGKQIRRFVTGDSYRAQHANTAHFGLGKLTEVASAEIIWPNGQRTRLVSPAINRYHRVTPGSP
ncbi:MAG: CRTAC1 family protein [Verrucomicrobia bacterium]|nr:CRTAC1 family protein [Verrucomicrobiota bacterium]